MAISYIISRDVAAPGGMIRSNHLISLAADRKAMYQARLEAPPDYGGQERVVALQAVVMAEMRGISCRSSAAW